VRDYVEVYLVLVKQGKLTPRLWPLPLGGRLWLDPQPAGNFTLQGVPADKDLVMVATGTGLGPYMSMLRTYGPALRCGAEPRWRTAIVIHGTRLCCDLGYMHELDAMSRRDPSIKYIPIVTREPEASQWRGMRGRVHVALLPEHYERLVGAPLDPAHAHVFLCGNPDMIAGVQKDLEARGFVARDWEHPEGNIHFERYW
jgi:ferredoxin--NADP+ reductase